MLTNFRLMPMNFSKWWNAAEKYFSFATFNIPLRKPLSGFLLGLMCVAAHGFGAGQAGVEHKAVESSTKEVVGELPKEPEKLRQFVEDANRQIESMELSLKQYEETLMAVEEMRTQISASNANFKFDKDALKREIQSRNFDRVQTALQELNMNFFDIGLPFFMLTKESVPSGPGRRIYNSMTRSISEVNEKYKKSVESVWPKEMSLYPIPLNTEKKNKIFLSDTEVETILTTLTPERKKSMHDEMLHWVDKAIEDVKKEISRVKEELLKIKDYRGRMLQSLNNSKKEINELAIMLGLPLFCSTIVVLFVIPFFSRQHKERLPRKSEVPGSFNFSTLVEISTVLLLTMSILILGLAGKLEPAVLGTLLGGISGYVLNRKLEVKEKEGGKYVPEARGHSGSGKKRVLREWKFTPRK